MKGTVITLTYDTDNVEEASKEFSKVVNEIFTEIEDKKGIKLITGTELNRHNTIIHHAYVNREINIDIKKIWKHGQSYIDHHDITDQSKVLKYIFC